MDYKKITAKSLAISFILSFVLMQNLFGSDVVVTTIEETWPTEVNEFLSAVCRSDVESARRLIKAYPLLINLYVGDVTSLRLAVQMGDDEMVELLVQSGADIHKIDSKGRTLLFLACANGHIETVKLLLRLGIDLHKVDSNGQTALFVACACGRDAIVEILIEKKASAGREDKNGWLPIAIELQDDMLQPKTRALLLRATVNLTEESLDRSAKASKNFAFSNSLTKFFPAYSAAISEAILSEDDYKRKVAVFLQAVHVAKTEEDFLHLEALCDKDPTLLKAKLAGVNAMTIAVCRNDQKTAMFLIKKDPSIIHEVEDKKGRNPLALACFMNSANDLIKFLVESEADVDAQDKDGSTPVMAAARSSVLGNDIFVSMLKRSQNVNAQDRSGNTALYYSSNLHNVADPLFAMSRIVDLLDHGARDCGNPKACENVVRSVKELWKEQYSTSSSSWSSGRSSSKRRRMIHA